MLQLGVPADRYPLRAILLATVSLLCYLAAMGLPFEFRDYFQAPFYPLVLGGGFYLVYRDGSVRLAGLAALLLLGLASSVNTIAAMYPAGGLHPATIMDLLFRQLILPGNLVNPALAAVFGLAASRRENAGRPAYRAFAALAATAVLVVSLGLHLKHGLMAWPGDVRLLIFIQVIITSLAVALAALLVKSFGETGGQRLSLSIGARIWCGLVSLAMVVVLIVNIANKQPGLVQSLLLLPTIIGMIILMFGVRGGFHLVLVGIGFVILQSVMMAARTGVNWPIFLGSLSGAVLNPVITWLLIRHAPPKAEVKRADRRSGQPGRRLPLAIPIVEILVSLFGVLLIVIAVVSMVKGKHLQASYISLAVGLALAGLFGTAAVLGFQKRGPSILHGICLLLAAGMVIAAILGAIFS